MNQEEIKARASYKYKNKYLYETHLHTCQGSACAKNTGAQMARACKEFGYAGIIVTDHFYYGNTAVDRSLTWSDWVESYCKGYEDAKREGDKIGLKVFFGWESGYDGTEFLIYGLDKQWLLEHPEIKDATVMEQYELVHSSGGIVIHAHPFREADYIKEIRLFPDYVDGVEVLNISNGKKLLGDPVPCIYDERAREYALEHDFAMTAGSDVHSIEMLGCGMGFDRELEDINDFVTALRNRESVVL